MPQLKKIENFAKVCLYKYGKQQQTRENWETKETGETDTDISRSIFTKKNGSKKPSYDDKEFRWNKKSFYHYTDHRLKSYHRKKRNSPKEEKKLMNRNYQNFNQNYMKLQRKLGQTRCRHRTFLLLNV